MEAMHGACIWREYRSPTCPPPPLPIPLPLPVPLLTVVPYKTNVVLARGLLSGDGGVCEKRPPVAGVGHAGRQGDVMVMGCLVQAPSYIYFFAISLLSSFWLTLSVVGRNGQWQNVFFKHVLLVLYCRCRSWPCSSKLRVIRVIGGFCHAGFFLFLFFISYFLP